MAKDSNWEFDCPQYIDLNEADHCNEEAEAYFDTNHEPKECFQLLSECAKSKGFKKQDFSVKLEQSSNQNSAVMTTNIVVKKKTRTTSERKAIDSSKSQRLNITYLKNPILQGGKDVIHRFQDHNNHSNNKSQPENKKLETNAKSNLKDAPVLCNQPQPTLDKKIKTEISGPVSFVKTKSSIPIKPESTVQGCQRKRSLSASEITSVSKKKKVTLPTTPLCLRRTLGKPKKILKTTEELEMEKIAAFRKQLAAQRKANEVLMKKIVNKITPLHNEMQTAESLRSQVQKITDKTGNNVKLSEPMPVSDLSIVHISNVDGCSDGMEGGVKASNLRANQCSIVKDPQICERTQKCQYENNHDLILPHMKNKYCLRSSCKKISITSDLYASKVQVKEKNINAQAANAFTNINDLLTTHLGLPFSSKRERKFTHVQPFSFDTRDQLRLAEKAQKIQDESEKNVKVQEFHAHHASKANPVLRKERSRRITKQIKPYSTDVQAKASARADKWQKEVEDQLERQREALFKAQPATVLFKEPFVPKKSSKPLTEITNIRLNTAERAVKREKFEECRKVKVAIQKEENDLLQEKLLKEEKCYIANLRAQLIQKATPIKYYKQIEVKSNKKARGLLMCNLKTR